MRTLQPTVPSWAGGRIGRSDGPPSWQARRTCAGGATRRPAAAGWAPDRRGGAACAASGCLARRGGRRAPPTSAVLPGVPATSSRFAHPAGCQGRLRMLSLNTILRFRPAAQDPMQRGPPQPSGCSLAAAGQSVQSRVVGAHSRRASLARAYSENSAPYAPGGCRPGAPSRGGRGGSSPLCALALLPPASLNLSLSTNSPAQRLGPDQWQRRTQRPATQRPLLPPFNTAPSGRPESCCSRASSKPTSPPHDTSNLQPELSSRAEDLGAT